MSISGPKICISNDIPFALKSILSHINSNGSSHSFINQDVSIDSQPTFSNILLSNTSFSLPNQAVSLGYAELNVNTNVYGGIINSNSHLHALTDNLTIFVSNNLLSLNSNLAGSALSGSFPLNIQTDNISIHLFQNQLRLSSNISGNGLIGGNSIPISVLTDNNSIDIFQNQLRLRSNISGNGLIGGNSVPISVLTDNNSIDIFENQLRLRSNLAGSALSGSFPLNIQTDNISIHLFQNQLRLSSNISGNGLIGGNSIPISVLTDNNSIDIFQNQLRLRSNISGNGLIGGNSVPISVLTDNVSIDIFENQLRLRSGVAGNGITGGNGSALSVLTDNNSIEISTDQIRIASGIAGNGLIGGSGSTLSVSTDTDSVEISSNQLRIASGAAGNGLIGGGSSSLSIGQGTGIIVNTNDISVSSNQPQITQLGNLGNLKVIGNTFSNFNFLSASETIIQGNVKAGTILLNNPNETIYYESVSQALNRFNMKYYVNTTTELISTMSLLNINGGGVVQLAPKVFEITTTAITVPKDTIIKGTENSTILRKAGLDNNINILELDSNTIIKNIIIDCNQQENTGITGTAHGIYFEGAKENIKIENVKIKNFGEIVLCLFGGNNTNTTRNFSLINSNITSNITSGGQIFNGNLENSFIYKNYFKLEQGRFINSGQKFSNVIIDHNVIITNLQSRIDTVGNCNLEINNNEFYGSSIDINSLNTGTTGAICDISYLSNFHISENKTQTLTLLGSNTSCNYIISENIFRDDYKIIHNNGKVNFSSITDNLFDRNIINDSSSIINSLFLDKVFISGNTIKNSNIYANCVVINTIDSNCVIGQNSIRENKLNPTFLNGLADTYYITTTTSVICNLTYLNKESRGHCVEIALQTDGGDFTLIPYHLVNGDEIIFTTNGDRVILEWDGHGWFIIYNSGCEIRINTIANVAITNIDTITTVSSTLTRSSNVYMYTGMFEIVPNTTTTKTEFTFDLPKNFNLGANTDFIGSGSGYNIDDNDISNLLIRGNTDGNRSNVYCSFTSTGNVKQHNIGIIGYYPGNNLIPGQILEQKQIRSSGSSRTIPLPDTQVTGFQSSMTFNSQHEVILIEFNLSFNQTIEQDFMGLLVYRGGSVIYRTYSGAPAVTGTLSRNSVMTFSERPGQGTFLYNVGTDAQTTGGTLSAGRTWVRYTRYYMPVGLLDFTTNSFTL